MKLVAGRTGQGYNQRKNRKGAYWEDRYHATAVESGEHLARCIIYIDIHPVKGPLASYDTVRPVCVEIRVNQFEDDPI